MAPGACFMGQVPSSTLFMPLLHAVSWSEGMHKSGTTAKISIIEALLSVAELLNGNSIGRVKVKIRSVFVLFRSVNFQLS